MNRAWWISSMAGLVLLSTAGCASDEEPTAVSPAEPPANACELVPESVITRWALTESDHASETEASRSEATCTMTGDSAGRPVDLEVDLVFFAGDDRDVARAAARDEAKRQCASIDSSAQSLSRDGCRQRGAGKP